ncbi:hypothetical protein U1Q18_037153 [Sarracenia purpurea var. burkii]
MCDYHNLVDLGIGNHRHKHLLPEHRLRPMDHAQHFTQSCNGVHWNHRISINGYLYPRYLILNVS